MNKKRIGIIIVLIIISYFLIIPKTFAKDNGNKNEELVIKKIITEVKRNNEIIDLSNNRNLNIQDENYLKEKENKSKEPITVEDGDIITYTLTIINKGSESRCVSEIIEQLPKGLILDNTMENEIISKDKNGNNKNTYTVFYDIPSLFNRVVLKIKNKNSIKSIEPLNNNEIDYETIEIRCKVVKVAGSKASEESVLTNKTFINKVINLKDKNEINVKNNSDYETIKIEPKILDLALRKYITKIEDKNGNPIELENRKPEVDESTVINFRSAIYNHKKDPITVKNGYSVYYNLTIYNEGQVNAYASQITDILPEGLSFEKIDNEDCNYEIEVYDESINKIVLKRKNKNEIKHYEEGKLEEYSETITIKCKVNTEKSNEILTNIAWISRIYDSYRKKEMFEDIDSQTETPLKNIPNLSTKEIGYTGKKNLDKNILSDKTKHIEGQQDDDDFEKIEIIQNDRIFDLALFEFISAISKDQTFENGEFLSDTKNQDGIYDRAPKASIKNNKIVFEEYSKEPLNVSEGDYVLYTIRVYNEGELNGYANKIKVSLPKGLKFVETNIDYNGYWKINLEELNKNDVESVETNDISPNNTKIINSINNEKIDYVDIPLLCQVMENSDANRILTNQTQILECCDENRNLINDIDSTPNIWEDPPRDDDQDFERIKIQCFDLALKQFITEINGNELKNSNGTYQREPIIDVSGIKNNLKEHNASYTHTKEPIDLQIGDKIVYTIRVYNEGDINAYANEITDYLPMNLEFVKNSDINNKYLWKMYDFNGNATENEKEAKCVKTSYLSEKEIGKFDGENLQNQEIKLECVITENAYAKSQIINVAEISQYKQENDVLERDIDSKANSLRDKYMLGNNKIELDETNETESEDDDDLEKINVKEFDLSLKTFITQIQDNKISTREPKYKYENDNISYEQLKDPVKVRSGDIIIYTLRVYNEGDINGYASEISDIIPEYLEYLPDHLINKEYLWKMYNKDENETNDANEAVKLKTNYLSKENGLENILNSFKKDNEISLDSKEIKIAFKVKDTNSNNVVIKNYAKITNNTDVNGNQIKDKDSNKDEWKEDDDTQDAESIEIAYFDLALKQFVSKVIIEENGNQKIIQTGYNEDSDAITKITLNKNKLEQLIVKIQYEITVTNEGEIPGVATEITDYIPEGLEFIDRDNTNWSKKDNNTVSTKQLEKKLLQPGESKTISLILSWKNEINNLNEKCNSAEITEYTNEFKINDRDSVVGNKDVDEDDYCSSKIELLFSEGISKIYIIIIIGIIVVIFASLIFIKIMVK